MYRLQMPAQDPIDEHWYVVLRQLLDDAGETFEVLMPPLERLGSDFRAFKASGYTKQPDLYPHILDTAPFVRIQEEAQKLRRQLALEESNEFVRELYDARIEELLLNMDMILAAAKQDDDAFLAANVAVYGSPDAEIFAAACTWVRRQALQTIKEGSVGKEAAADVLRMIPDLSGDPARLQPDRETFMVVKARHHELGGYMEQLFGEDVNRRGVTYTPEIGDAITLQAIYNVGSAFELKVSPVGLWSVLQSKQTVIRPAEYKLSTPAFHGIVAHEVGSHLLEATNGSKSRLKLLELGLDHYEAGNEGRAFLREQIMFETFDGYIYQPDWHPDKASWEYRVAIHIAVSMAYGLGGKLYNFIELYNLLTALFSFWTAYRSQVVDEDRISRGAWSMAVRVMKGTGGNGGAYLKDIVYLEGNIRCWQSAKVDPNIILQGDLGKFDISNTAHGNMLRAIGVL